MGCSGANDANGLVRVSVRERSKCQVKESGSSLSFRAWEGLLGERPKLLLSQGRGAVGRRQGGDLKAISFSLGGTNVGNSVGEFISTNAFVGGDPTWEEREGMTGLGHGTADAGNEDWVRALGSVTGE